MGSGLVEEKNKVLEHGEPLGDKTSSTWCAWFRITDFLPQFRIYIIDPILSLSKPPEEKKLIFTNPSQFFHFLLSQYYRRW